MGCVYRVVSVFGRLRSDALGGKRGLRCLMLFPGVARRFVRCMVCGCLGRGSAVAFVALCSSFSFIVRGWRFAVGGSWSWPVGL